MGRQFAQSAMQTMTGQSSNPISRRAFESSVKKGGDFANSVTGAVAQGNINYTGYMTGEGKIAYHENLVQKLPNMPKRKDRV